MKQILYENGKRKWIGAFFVLLLFAAGCMQTQTESDSADGVVSSVSAKEEISSADGETSGSSQTDADRETMEFTDVRGEVHTLQINPYAAFHDYNVSCFVKDGQDMLYTDTDAYICRVGIDVSRYQGDIDWERVKEAGYTFVFIRIGLRGYGEAGNLAEDEMFQTNLTEAKEAGLDVGVYFYSQAVSGEEAAEEAAFVLELLGDAKLDLPVVYDPEYILDEDGNQIAEARTSGLDGEQMTKNTVVFCETVEEAGYDTAYYTNLLSQSEVFDMEALSGYTVWYADYCDAPQTPYEFSFWQYSESGTVDGINGDVDLNIQLIRAED